MNIDIACAEHGFATNCQHNQPRIIRYVDHDYIPYDERFEGIWWWDSRYMKWCAYAEDTTYIP